MDIYRSRAYRLLAQWPNSYLLVAGIPAKAIVPVTVSLSSSNLTVAFD